MHIKLLTIRMHTHTNRVGHAKLARVITTIANKQDFVLLSYEMFVVRVAKSQHCNYVDFDPV